MLFVKNQKLRSRNLKCQASSIQSPTEGTLSKNQWRRVLCPYGNQLETGSKIESHTPLLQKAY